MINFLRKILKPFYNFVYWVLHRTLKWNPFIKKELSGKKVKSGHIRLEQEMNPELDSGIVKKLNEAGVPCLEYWIDELQFEKYLQTVVYPTGYYHHKNYSSEFREKALEHFISICLMKPVKTGKYIDIGAGNSPFSRILSYHNGIRESYRQDIIFSKYNDAFTIGGNAASLPLADDSIEGITLHCSFEHFEGNSDRQFIREAFRILKKGGQCIILPLYLSSEYALNLDPVLNFLKNHAPDISHDAEAEIHYCDSR